MRVVAVFLLAFVAVAAARTTFKSEKAALRKALLSAAQAPSLSHLARSSKRFNALKGTGSDTAKSQASLTARLVALARSSKGFDAAVKRTDNSESSDDDYCDSVDIPCLDTVSNVINATCAEEEASDMVGVFMTLFFENTGEDLFGVHASSLIGKVYSAYYEGYLNDDEVEIFGLMTYGYGEHRFEEYFDWEAATEDVISTILDMDCIFDFYESMEENSSTKK